MPTNTWPIGEQSRVRFGAQSDPLTQSTGDFYDLPYYSASFTKERPLQDDRVLGAGWNNPTDSRAAAPGLVAASGKMEIPADVAALGLMLTAILGAGAVAANGAGGANDKTWTFTSGGVAVPVYSVEVMKAAGMYDVALGAFAKSVAFSFKGGDQGYAKVTTDWGAVDIEDSQADSIAGSPTVLAGVRFPGFLGTLDLAGVAAGAVMDTTVTLTNEYDEDRYLNSATLGGVGLKSMALKIEATLRYTGDAIRAYGEVASNGLPAAIGAQLALSIDATHGLTLAMPNVRFEPVGTPIEGPGGLQVKLQGRAEQSSSAAMVTATLLNQIASYA